MGLLHGNRRSRSAHADRGNRYYPTFRLLERDVVDTPTRYEPQTLSAPRRPPTLTRRGGPSARPSGTASGRGSRRSAGCIANEGRRRLPTREAAAAEAVRWVNRYEAWARRPPGAKRRPGARAIERPGGRERPGGPGRRAGGLPRR